MLNTKCLYLSLIKHYRELESEIGIENAGCVGVLLISLGHLPAARWVMAL